MEISYDLDNANFFDITPSLFSYEIIKEKTVRHPRIHNYYLFCFIVDGSAIFFNGKTNFELKKNQAMLFFPNEEMSFTVSTESSLKIIQLGFFGIKATDFISKMNIKPENPVFDFPVSKELLVYFPSNINTKKGGYYQALSALFKVFAHISTEQKNTYIKRATNYIDLNIEKPIRVIELSSILGISRIHLYNIFAEYLGISPKEYIINRKLNIAYNLIKSNNFSVLEAAKKVGYNDQFAFSKIFKAKYHISPMEAMKGKVPHIKVLDDEKGENIWPAEITSERSKVGSHSYVAKPYYNKERDIVEGWLIRTGHVNTAPLPRTLDISLLTENGNKGALTFWIFVENQSMITNWQLNTADWIRFGSSLNWDTDFQYWLGWHKQIVKEGWNKIILPFGDSEWGHVSGKPDYKNFCSFSIMLSLKPLVRVFIDDIKVIPGI